MIYSRNSSIWSEVDLGGVLFKHALETKIGSILILAKQNRENRSKAEHWREAFHGFNKLNSSRSAFGEPLQLLPHCSSFLSQIGLLYTKTTS